MQTDYKSTLNLPRTDFSMKADLARKGPELLQSWEKMDLYGKIRRARRGRPRYILHDGPPYPTGDLHIGTGMNKILKDIIVRFYTMTGFDAPFIPGWDCHGLPIEHKVMAELGNQAARMSDAEIRRRCLEFAMMYVEANRKQFKGLGCLGDWSRPYLTVSPQYEAAVLKVFRKLVERGYVYRQNKPIHWCFSCRTALAEAELEYEDRSDVSIYIELPLSGAPPFPGASILVWTTTPWTLPGNRAVAVHPEFEYALLSCERPGGKGEVGRVIVAAEAAGRLAKELGISSFSVSRKLKGADLENLRYRHPWSDRDCPVVLARYVNLEEGTGCVHTAPGHGEEDYRTGQEYRLEVFSPVDPQGRFTEEVPDLEGKEVMAANELIIERLSASGRLWFRKDLVHSYPHCWRCHRPVIFRATQQWFVSLQNRGLRERALEEIDRIVWVPDWGKARIRSMVEQRPDWCISRQRKWGVPIPVFYCRACSAPVLDLKVIDRAIRIFAEKGADCWFALPESELLPPETKCPACGKGEFQKENDIFDVWFESGSSHRAVVMENPELQFPADLYLEGSDQHRGWFQLSLLLAVAGLDQAPFRSVLTHGFVVDQRGEKMSKSRGNFISVEEGLKRFSADILRLWFSSVDWRRDINVAPALIEKINDSYRKIRNTIRHLLGNLHDFDPARDALPYGRLLEIDRWALQEVEKLREVVERAYREFEFHRVYRDIHNFCVVQMSSFYLDALKDRLYTRPAGSPERRSSQTAFWEILNVLVRLLAPLLPFTGDEVWKHLGKMKPAEESVHLALWPSPRREWKDAKLTGDWDRLLAVRGRVLKQLEEFRRRGVIGNSLEARVDLDVSEPGLAGLLKRCEPLLPTIFIVSRAVVRASPPGSEAGEATEIPGLRIGIGRAEGGKCVRCWKYSPSVGESESHPGICRECLQVVQAGQGQRE